MSRIVRTGLIPNFPEDFGEGVLLVTLSSLMVTGRGSAVRRLNSLAAVALRKKVLAAAAAPVARHLLRRTVAKEFPGVDAAAFAKRLGSSLSIVLRTGIDPAKLVEFGSERVRQLGQTARAYRSALRSRNLIDGAESLRMAVECGPEPRRMVIIGHYRARKEEIEFIDAIAADGSVYYLPCGDAGFFAANRHWAEYLAKKGWEVIDEEPTRVSAGEGLALLFANGVGEPDSVSALEYPNVEAEVRGTLGEVKKLIIGGADPYSMVIAARDLATYAPVVAAVADEYGLPVRIDHNVSLGSTAFGGFIRKLMDAAGNDLPFETTLRLVMHSFGPKIAPAKLAEARRTRVSGVARWCELLPELSCLSWPEGQPFELWAAGLRSALDALGVRQKAAGRSAELAAYHNFQEALSAGEPPEDGHHLSFEAFAAIVSDILSDESTPLRPARAGVALVEPKNIVGSVYERIFVLGMAEGVYPKPASEDPVVDFHERKELAPYGIDFADAAEVARWEELSFYFTLLAARGPVVLSCPRIMDRGESVPSSFFGRLGIKPVDAPQMSVAASVEELRSAVLRHDLTAEDNVLQFARHQYLVERRRESSAPYDEYDGETGATFEPASLRWSASQLTVIGQCSFRWFAQRLLHLKPADEMATGLEASTRGKLYHKALELAVERAISAPDIRAATLANLDAAFADAEKDEDVGLPDLPNWEIERLEQLRDLKKAVAAPDFIAPDSRVVGIEQEFKDVWRGFPVTGFIDRVDDTPEGLIAIDYKTSSAVPKGAKGRDGKLSVDVQIPLYANVALPKLYPEGILGDSAYYSLTKGKILRRVKAGDMENLEMLGDDITGILARGSFAVDPDIGEQACTYCELAAVCRKGPRLRRKSRA